MSKINLPELPPIPWNVLGGIANDCVSAEAIHDYATAYAEQAVREAVTARAEDEAQHQVNAAMAAEYQRWIDYYHQGRDYDSFLKECVYGHKPVPVDIGSGHKNS